MSVATIARGEAGLSVTASGRVQELVTGKGIRAYLVPERAVPILSLAFWFRGGGAADPEDLPGLAHMTSGVIDEGAGPYDSQAFRRELEDHAIRLGFDADRDGFVGDLKTLTVHREHAFELLRLALMEARLDDEPIERVRSQILVDITRRETDPDYLASRGWFEAAFPNHPYRLPTRGTRDSVGRIDAAAMRDYARSRLARDTLLVAVAGDIEVDALAVLLDRTFGDLPATAPSIVDVAAPPVVGETRVTHLPIPQSVVTFGHAGVDRRDPDRYAAFVANHILGGGGFSSRLIEEVREKRGLAYSVYSHLFDTRAAPLWLGGVATSNERVAESLSLIRAERTKLAAGEVSEAELGDAKTYLTGSFPLRLTSNDMIVKTLMSMLVDGLGRDFLDRRNELVEAVSLDDVRRASARLFARDLLVSVVGAPVGL